MSNKKPQFIVPAESSDRLDIFLATALEVSRSQVQKFIQDGMVLINGVVTTKNGQVLKEGDVVSMGEKSITEDSADAFVPRTFLPIEILAETDDYVVVDKPSGLLTHPTQALEKESLAAWLLERYPKIATVGDSPERPGIVHRLDKEASGVLVVAKTQKMFDHLKKQFQDRTIIKEYSVLVHEVLEKDHGELTFAIDRGTNGKMVARPLTDTLSLKTVLHVKEGKEAITEYWVEKRFTRYSLLRVRIHTGRTHQIRVHFYAYNHPVVGDNLYFNKKLNRKRDQTLGRVFLHAEHLTFSDLEGKEISVTAKLPVALTNFLADLN